MDTHLVSPPPDTARKNAGKTTLIPPSPTVTVAPPRPQDPPPAPDAPVPEPEGAPEPHLPQEASGPFSASPSVPPPPPPPSLRTPEGGRARSVTMTLLRHVFHGCLTASFLFTIVVILLIVMLFRRCNAMIDSAGGMNSAQDPFAKEEVADLNLGAGDAESGTPRVLVVRLRGTMLDVSGTSDASVGQAIADVRRARFDQEIDGILLDVDSPGGEVTASDALWSAIKEFRESRTDTQVPRFTVALMGATAASGAYYACSAADWIIARPTTLTGSIGVKIESFNVRKLAEDHGVHAVSVTSGPHKNMLDPFTDLTEEQRRMLQTEVDALHALFVSRVTEGRRGLAESKVKELANGRVFLGPEAKDLGLVDAVGHLDAALSEVRRRLGGDPVYVRYVHPRPLLETLLPEEFSGSLPLRLSPSLVLPGPAPHSETPLKAIY